MSNLNEHNHFIRKNNNYSPELIKQVVDYIQTTQTSCRRAAKFFNIPKSTIQRWWKKRAQLSIDSNSEQNVDGYSNKEFSTQEIQRLQQCLLQISNDVQYQETF